MTDRTPTEPTLLPCPLCEGEAEFAFNPMFKDRSMAQCKSCGATAFWRKWNRRAASPAAPGAEVEPVAFRWRYRYSDGRAYGWAYQAAPLEIPAENDTLAALEVPSTEVEPLYLSPPTTDAIRAQARREALEEGAVAGWNACRRSIYAVCEDVDAEADKAKAIDAAYGRGLAHAAKSIARGFGAMEARDDDNFTAAIRTLEGETE